MCLAMANGNRGGKTGKFCVAGGPGNVSCTNNSYTPGISMHVFPKNELVKRQWTNFVRRHRFYFSPTASSALCSVHFEPNCYTRLSMAVLQPDVSAEERIGEKRILERGAVPTIDVAIETGDDRRESQRDIRMARKVSHISYCHCICDKKFFFNLTDFR